MSKNKKAISKGDLRLLENVLPLLTLKKSDIQDHAAIEELKNLCRLMDTDDLEVQAAIVRTRINILNSYAGDYAEKDQMRLFDHACIEEGLLRQLIIEIDEEDDE